MSARAVIVALAAIGIPIALLVTLLPLTWGYAGMLYGFQGVGVSFSSGPYATVYYVDPQGPAYRAGVRQGDRVIPTSGVLAVYDTAGPAGTTMLYRIARKDGIHRIPVTFVPFSGALALQEQVNKVLGALTALAAFLVAILVALRARERDAGTRAAGLLFFTGFSALCASLALVCGNAWLGMTFTNWLPPYLQDAAMWFGLALLAIYPPQRTRLRDLLVYAGPLAVLWTILGTASSVARIFASTSGALLGVFGGAAAIVYAPLLFDLAIVVQIVAAVAAARGSYRTPVAWLGGLWLLSLLIHWVPLAAYAAGTSVLLSHYGDAIEFVSVACLGFGVAYPVLRHRMVDLNIIVTRATVYAVVSAIIVGVFIGGEWALGKIFETSLGFSKESGSLAAQLASLVLVLILGISARSIHRFIEERLTNTFFRKRMAGLATITRLAHEADSVTDVHAYMDLAVRKVEQSLETGGAAFYVRSGDAYACASVAGAPAFASTYAAGGSCRHRLRAADGALVLAATVALFCRRGGRVKISATG